MAIRNDNELAEATQEAGRLLQDIQNYLGGESHPASKVRFPRGYIRTADYFRQQFRFIADSDIRSNLAYALILSDVYRWLTNRTDLFGSAKEMALKAGIVLCGSICETIAVSYTRGVIGGQCRFKVRCARMVTAEMIDEDLSAALCWLWDTRSAIHIHSTEGREYERYGTREYNRAIRCVRSLRDQLAQHSAIGI